MNHWQPSILIVEDDETNRSLIKALLNLQGYHTSEAESGQQTLARLETDSIDLVLMDIDLPDIDGLTLIKKIHAEKAYCHLPVIVLSGYVQETDIRAAYAAGAKSHIPKPVQIQQLLSEIKRLL